MTRTLYITLILALAVPAAVSAQEENSSKGYLSGSFETNNILYQNDSPTGAVAPENRIGSNNYLKLDYYRGKFSAGAQLEGYFPVLQDYPIELTKAKLTNYYVSWTDDAFSVTAGTFYDQFGSGLLFRAWEDRTLGMNNAVMGARVTYNYKGIVSVKALWGLPRMGMEFSDTQVRGGDISFAISELAKWDGTYLALEGSVLNRFEDIPVDLEDEGGKPGSTGYSGRINFEHGSGFFLKAEYVDGGQKYYSNPDFASDGKMYLQKRGNAQLVELGYNNHGLGVNFTARRLEWMTSKIMNNSVSTANLLNYVPAVSTQYTYLLTNFHPYTVQLGEPAYRNSGEMGGQLDVYYNFRRGTALGGKRGMKIHANFSTYYTLAQEGTAKAGNLLYRDFSVDIEKQFSRKFKALLLYSMQEQNTHYGVGKATRLQNIVVADMQYKFTPTFSTRLELQYLATHEDEKDWMAALLEVNFAPYWSIYVSDMYNHGSSNVHYYAAGVSYARSRTRVSLSYGRNKDGYVCSGGVCRVISAYTGLNLQLTTSF